VQKGEIMEWERNDFGDESIACILDVMQHHAQPMNVIKNNFGISNHVTFDE
jgi:hypothetical protein